MEANPYLKKLGFAESDRVAIIHADDIGMSQATLPAIAELFDFGLVSSAALMVPCPWYPGAVAYAAGHPQSDFGVHLTLNSEWESVRWGPISTREAASGLMDDQGYFYNDTAPTQQHANLNALRQELDEQLARARRDGLQITHADTHMFCLGHERLIGHYVDAALAAGTLPILLRPGGPGWHKMDLAENQAVVDSTSALAQRGLPMVDDIYMMNLDTHEDRLPEAMQALDALQPGFTHFILHPAIDTAELRAMAPDWRCRVADYQVFQDRRLGEHIRQLGIQIIGYRELLSAMSDLQ